MKFILGLFFGGILGILTLNQVQELNNSKELKRGDNVILLNDDGFYKNCKITFIASQAIENENIAFVLLKDCDFQLNNIVQQNPTTDMFLLKDLQRIKE